MKIREIPWRSADLVLRHRRAAGSFAFVGAGVAAVAGVVLGEPVEAFGWILAGVLYLEGAVLAFPRPRP